MDEKGEETELLSGDRVVTDPSRVLRKCSILDRRCSAIKQWYLYMTVISK